MKKFLSYSAIITLLALFPSCELLEDLDDVDFTANYTVDFPIDVSEENATVAAMEILNITEDDDVEEYKDKLQDIAIDSIEIGFAGFTGNADATLSGTLQYGIDLNSGLTPFVSVFNVSPKDYADNAERMKLDLTAGELDALTDMLMNEEQITIAVAGSVANGPASFTAKVYFYTTITADALK